MFCFEILGIFGEKSQKRQRKFFGHIGLLHRSVGNPRRSVGCVAAARPRGQNGTLRLHSVAVLRLGEDTVQNEQNSWIVVSKV